MKVFQIEHKRIDHPFIHVHPTQCTHTIKGKEKEEVKPDGEEKKDDEEKKEGEEAKPEGGEPAEGTPAEGTAEGTPQEGDQKTEISGGSLPALYSNPNMYFS